MATKSRLLSRLIEGDGSIKTTQIDSDAIGTSAAKSITAAAGTTIYSSADTLPASADAGDQAFVSSTNRLYIYNGSGWYNIALINYTPYWITEADSSYTLSTTGGATIIEILAGDSDGTIPSYTATTDSDFNQVATITQDSDSRWIITPIDSENGTAVAGTGTVTFKATDGVNLVSTLSTFSLTFITAIENSAETTLLLKADTTGTDNQVDASTNNHTITENGNVKSTAFTPYHPGGYSTYFDGSSDYLSTTSYSEPIGTDDFTIECWVYIVSRNTNGAWLFAVNNGISQSNSDGMQVYYRNSSNSYDWAHLTGGSQYNTTTASVLNQWTHIALTRESGTVRLFADGVLIDTQSSITTDMSTYDDITIGQAWTNGLNGYIKDLRIVKGTALYTAAFTPPTEALTAIAGTKYLACHLPYFADGSTNGNTITVTGNTLTKRFGPYDYIDPYTKADHGGAVYFDGSGDYLSGNDMGLGGAGAFTVEAWMYPTVYNTYANDIYSHGANSSVGADFLAFGLKSDGNVQMFKGSGSPALLSTSAPCATLNQWYHVAFVRESNNNTSAYVNGVLVAGPTTLTGALTSAPSGRAFIGTQSYSAGASDRSFEGYMRDVRIVNGTAVYTSAFTSPTEPLTAIANTSLLTCHAPYIADGSTNSHAITVNGNTLTKRFGPYDYSSYTKADHGGSVYFDGSGDYLTVPDGAYKTYGSGNFTIEMWFYADAAFPYNWLLADPNNAFTTSTMSVGIYLENSNVKAQVITSAGTRSLNHTTSVYQNTWNHIAVTRNGTALTLWINGVANTPTTISGSDTVNDSSNILNIGRGSVDYPLNFSGYISDFRIVKGTAVYTSAFTPPTAPLTAITNTSLLTCTNKSQVWDVSGSELPGPVYNNGASIQSGVTHTGFNAGYFLFDGTNDWIQIPYDLHQNANFGTGDFTIEFWLYPHVDELSTMIGNDIATPGNWNGWLIKRNSAPSQNTLYLQWNGSGMIETSLATAGAGTYTVNTWHHFAATRQNGTLRTFFNGNLIGSTSFTADMTDTNYLTIGMNNYAGGTEHFDGALKEIRFTKGLARYTSTFTPPTAEFKG